MCESSSSMFSIYHMFYCIIMLILGLNRCTLRTIKCIIIIRIVNLFIRIYMPFGYSQFAIDCLSLMHVDQRLGHCVLSGQIKVAGSDTGLGQFTSLHHSTPVPWSHNSMVNPHGFDNNNGVEISGYKCYWEIIQLFIQRYSNILKIFYDYGCDITANNNLDPSHKNF